MRQNVSHNNSINVCLFVRSNLFFPTNLACSCFSSCILKVHIIFTSSRASLFSFDTTSALTLNLQINSGTQIMLSCLSLFLNIYVYLDEHSNKVYELLH